MKAIVFAGENDGRMRPMTNKQPKCMIPLFGKPLLEHFLLLLRKNGVGDVLLLLHEWSDEVQDYFGDGHCYGMNLTYLQEDTLGSADALRACQPFVEKESVFLVAHCDCLCDFDLQGGLQQHQQRDALATLFLHRMQENEQCTLVETDAQGRITQLVEPSAWNGQGIFQVNTGIYLFNPAIFELIPQDSSYSLEHDLFPALFHGGERLMGFVPYGVWCPISDCRTYMHAVRQVLSGALRLEHSVPQLRGGMWCGCELPDGVTVLPPCYIAEGVTVSAGATLGANTVVECGSVIGARAVVQGSILLGASVGEGAAVSGSILCAGASVENGAVLNQGVVLGAGATVGQNAILRDGVKVWDSLRVKANARLNTSLTTGNGAGQLLFNDSGTLCGRMGLELTPEVLVSIGSLLGADGRVTLGHSTDAAAQALCMAAVAGVIAAGGTAVLHDGSTPSAAAWLSSTYSLPISLFIAQNGEQITLYFYERHGLPLSRARQRRLEQDLLCGVLHRAPAGQVGQREHMTDIDRAYLTDAVRSSGAGALRPLSISVPNGGAQNALLKQALSQLGMDTQAQPSIVSLCLSPSGQHLLIQPPNERPLSPEKVSLLTLFLLMESGEREFVLPPAAPLAAEELAQAHSCCILRAPLDDSRTKEHTPHQLALRDGIFAACLLCRRMAQTGETLSRLLEQLPPCYCKREQLTLNDPHILQRLSARYPQAESSGDGIRISLGGGNIFVEPNSQLSTLRIAAEAHSTEAATELCSLLCEQARSLAR